VPTSAYASDVPVNPTKLSALTNHAYAQTDSYRDGFKVIAVILATRIGPS